MRNTEVKKIKRLYTVNVTEPPEEQPQTPSGTTGVNFGDVSAAYTYDANNRLLTDSRGDRTSTYTYDSLDRLTGVNFGDVSAAYTYDANNRLLTDSRGNRTSTYTYNKAGLVTALQNSSGDMYNYSYTYRLDGKLLTRDNGDYTNEYRYNDLGQLIRESEEVTTIWYTYDTRGNRTKLYTDDDYDTTTYEYDRNNRLLNSRLFNDVIYRDYRTSYSYDKNGNMTERSYKQYDKNGSILYSDRSKMTYNSRNQMDEVVYNENNSDEEDITAYGYDAIGRLIEKDLGYTKYRWDRDNMTGEKGGSNNTTYYRGINLIAQNTSKTSGSTMNYYVYNEHNDTTALLDINGTVTARYDYSGFGDVMYNTQYERFGYNGQYYDIHSELIYLRNRYYDPTTGRFTQEDTYWNVNNMIYGDNQYEEGETKIPDYFAIAQSGNLYAYCMNDPVNLCDILGSVAGDLFKTSDDAAIDWAWNYYGITNYSNIEHSSLLYMIQGDDGEWYYSYTVADDFEPLRSDPYSLQHHVDGIGGITVGFIHSHPFTNYPSNIDKNMAENNGHIIYVVGWSLYSDGVDVCKYYDYGYGFSAYAVGSDLSYRKLNSREEDEANEYFMGKWNLYYDDIQKGYNYKWKERGYL